MVEEMYQQEFQEKVQPSSAEKDPSQVVVPPGGATAYSGEYMEFGGGGNVGAAGEVSLTLGLRRHSENVPKMRQLSIRDFEAY